MERRGPTLLLAFRNTFFCGDVALMTPTLDWHKIKDDLGSPRAQAERASKRCSDVDDGVDDSVEKKVIAFFFLDVKLVSFVSGSFLLSVFTLRSVVTVVANSCPPTQSVTMEEGDRGLSGGSMFFSRRQSTEI